MHRSSGAPRRLLQQEDQRDHARTDDCEKPEYIDIAQDTGLSLDRLVDDQNRFPLSIGETRTAGQQMTAEQSCPFKIGRVAARYVLHVLLVYLLVACQHRRKERGPGRTTDVAREVCKTGNVVVLARRKTDVNQGIDGHEQECQANGLRNRSFAA
jgi:hypothetical protein